MRLTAYHLVALVANSALAVIALTDAVTHALTGSYSVFAEDSGNTAAQLAGEAIHGVAYASLVVVLLRERSRFAAANRFARVLRAILLVLFGALAAAFLVVTPAVTFAAVPADSFFWSVSGMVGTVAFAGMLLASTLLGFALLRRNPLGLGGRVLLGAVPAVLLVVVLAFTAPAWAHPGVVELVVGVGVALLGVAPAPRQVLEGADATPMRPPGA